MIIVAGSTVALAQQGLVFVINIVNFGQVLLHNQTEIRKRGKKINTLLENEAGERQKWRRRSKSKQRLEKK